ncbi:hypothetical protein FBU59_001555 [Linderina macrospora]|uniref:Uncharacterized protein n=1 Tax=Linderina macrospora TaxID=4868 RepID=A0ACC1JDI1_9FUNG|nr:hypothetical protein FBU59_001555 [Linderina macrospora]
MGALAHRLSFFSRSKSPVESALSSGANTPAPFVDSDFSPANLTHGDPAPMTDSAMIARRLRDIPLPHADSGMDWFWLSDWAAFVGSKPELAEDGVVAQLTDRNGWEYSAHGFNSPETVWAPYVPADAADCVRRRRWVRAMKRQVPLDDPTAVIAANPVLAKINHDHAAPALDSDYLETARSILDATRDIATSDAAVERRLELEQTRSAVSVLLSNIATDHNNDRRREARRLADDALKRAEVLAAGLQGDTQDELCQALNETENALGIMSLPGSADAVVPPPLPQRTRVEPPTDPLEVERQVQGYLEQAEREFTPAVVPPKDEVVEEFDDDRLFDKTVHHIKPTKAARSDGSVSDVVAKVTITESGSVEEEEAGGNSSSSRLDNSQIANNNDAEEEEEELADTELSPQDLRTALFMRQSLPESAWEPDEATSTCRQDARRFTLFLRRHHCRRCGLVFCDSCSSQRALLASPVSPAGFYGESADSSLAPYHPPGGESCWQLREQRVCNACFDTLASVPPINSELVQLPVVPHHSGTIENAYTIFGSPEDPIADLQSRHHSHRHRRRVSSSSIRICPVCDKDWVAVWQNMVRMPGEGWQEAQERHIRECIEDTSAGMQGGVSRHHAEAAASDPAAPSPVELPRRSVGFLSFFDRLSPTESEQPQQPVVPHHQPASQPEQSLHTMSHSARAARSPMGVKYIAYRLTGDTQLLGQECAICFEDFEPGQTVARLNCLCTYHLECIAEWLQRTPACPVHYE